MSGMEGSRFARYHGACWRARWTSAVGLPCRAYQVMVMVWQSRPKGDGALDGLGGAVAGLPDAGDALGVVEAHLDRPALRVALE